MGVRTRRRAAAIVTVALLAVTFATAASTPTAASPNPKTALVYGDSLMFESRFQIASFLGAKPGWTLWTHTWPGSAPCEWLEWIDNDLAAYRPSVFVIETAANRTAPCLGDSNGGVVPPPNSAAYYDKYRADLATFFEKVTNAGAKVVFVKAPPFTDSVRNTGAKQIGVIATELAAGYPGVSISAAARNAVSASGKYVSHKNCLANETAEMGCSAGKIAVRTLSGQQAGLHLCPDGLADTYPFACRSDYASGEVRWGKSVATVIVKPPPPVAG